MPKVLRIINRFNLGGPTYNVAYLSHYMAPDFETLLVGGEKDDSEDSSQFITEQLGLKPVIVQEMKRAISLKDDYIAYKKLVAIIKEYQPDIVHTHASKAGLLGRLAAKKCGVKHIYHTFHGHVFHSYFNPVTTFIFKVLERYCASFSTRIIAISNKQREELAFEHKIAPFEKFTVVPLGFDLQRFAADLPEKRKTFRAEWQLDDETVAIGIVGRLVPVKNHPLFLRGIAHLKQHTDQKFRAFLVGDGESKEELIAYCKALSLSFSTPEAPNYAADVIFTSWIRQVDKAYPGFDIVALTSFNEGTPVSLIEAQAAGIPIISTNVGGIQDIVQEGKTALLCPVENEALFFEHMLNLVENAATRAALGTSGNAHVMQQFHYTRLVNDMKKLYKSAF